MVGSQMKLSQFTVAVISLSVFSGCASDKPVRLDTLMANSRAKAVATKTPASSSSSNFSMSRSPDDYMIDTSKHTANAIKQAEKFKGKKPSIASRFRSVTDAVGGSFRSVSSAGSSHVSVAKKTNDPTSLSSDPGPLKPELFLASAALHEKQGALDRALAQYQKVLEMDPSSRPAMIGMGRLLHRQGRMQEAIAVYRRAVSIHQNDPVVANDLGLCLARSGQFDEAVRTLDMAVRLNPSNTMYRNNLAAVLVESNRARDAYAVLEQTYGPAIASYNVGYLLNQRGNQAQAHEYLTQSLQHDPNLRQARVILNRMNNELEQSADSYANENPPFTPNVRNARQRQGYENDLSVVEPATQIGTDAEIGPTDDTLPSIVDASQQTRPTELEGTPRILPRLDDVAGVDTAIVQASAMLTEDDMETEERPATQASPAIVIPTPNSVQTEIEPMEAAPGMIRMPPKMARRKLGELVPPLPSAL